MAAEEQAGKHAQPGAADGRGAGACPLGEVVNRYIAEALNPQHETAAKVAAAWQEVVPAAMAGHCRLAEVSRGTARILVSSPSYLHQLRLMEAQLLAGLQQKAGRKAVRGIRFQIGR
jgi:predicted nucleic acid-binding Zn ribbon protein